MTELDRVGSPLLSVDHFLIACADLAEGCAYLESLFGCCPQVGGAHPGMGTRNALLALENNVYIEVIAPDPQQPGNMPFRNYLYDVSQPSLMWWSIRCENLDALQALAQQCGVEACMRQPGSRTTPDGQELEWDLLLADQPQLGALMPFYIHWRQMELHPSRAAPLAGELLEVELQHRGDSIAGLLPSGVNERPQSTELGMRAVFKAAGKTVSLQSPDEFAPAIVRIMMDADVA